MRYFSCTFPPVLSFLVIVLHLGKCWGLFIPVHTADTCYENTEYTGVKGTGLHCIPGGQTPRRGSVLGSVMKWDSLLSLTLRVLSGHLDTKSLGCLFLHDSVVMFLM